MKKEGEVLFPTQKENAAKRLTFCTLFHFSEDKSRSNVRRLSTIAELLGNMSTRKCVISANRIWMLHNARHWSLLHASAMLWLYHTYCCTEVGRNSCTNCGRVRMQRDCSTFEPAANRQTFFLTKISYVKSLRLR